MNTEIDKEVEELKEKLALVYGFAERLPVFKKAIIEKRYTGQESSLMFGEKYKGIPLRWGIRRFHFHAGSSYQPTNYEGEYTGYLFNIYINTYSLFGDHWEGDLDDIVNEVEVEFYDELNTTFYAADDQIEALLERLNDWYKNEEGKAAIFTTEKELKRANELVERLELRLKKLKENKS